MIVLGLTGSIGMGKSATLALFKEFGAAIYDADAAVHALYAKGGAAVEPVGAAFPGVVKDGAVDRQALSRHVIDNPEKMRLLESIVHPLARQNRLDLEALAQQGYKVAVLDIPLLFESGIEKHHDAVVVCSAPVLLQVKRALARPNLDYHKLSVILGKQVPDAKKRALADYVVDTSRGEDDAREQVAAIMKAVTAPEWRSRKNPDKGQA